MRSFVCRVASFEILGARPPLVTDAVAYLGFIIIGSAVAFYIYLLSIMSGNVLLRIVSTLGWSC